MSNRPSNMHWTPIQTALEDAVSDILLIMDCPYWSPLSSKRHGVLEVLAGCASEDSEETVIPPGFFAKAVSRKLEDRAAQSWRGPPYLCNVCDLPRHVAAVYRNHVREMRHNEQRTRNFPPPLHMLIAGRSTQPTSIQLAPRSQREERRAEPEIITLSLNSVREENRESLNEWFRMRPANIQIKMEGCHGIVDRTDPASGLLLRAETVQIQTEEKGLDDSSEVP